jgi:hypothetical protein
VIEAPAFANMITFVQRRGGTDLPRSLYRGGIMDTTTLLIIIVVVILLGGGGWYGRGRWY